MDDIKGSKVLDRIIKHFVKSDYSYSKPRNGAVLVEWLLTNNPNSLKEISDLLGDFLKK